MFRQRNNLPDSFAPNAGLRTKPHWQQGCLESVDESSLVMRSPTQSEYSAKTQISRATRPTFRHACYGCLWHAHCPRSGDDPIFAHHSSLSRQFHPRITAWIWKRPDPSKNQDSVSISDYAISACAISLWSIDRLPARDVPRGRADEQCASHHRQCNFTQPRH